MSLAPASIAVGAVAQATLYHYLRSEKVGAPIRNLVDQASAIHEDWVWRRTGNPPALTVEEWFGCPLCFGQWIAFALTAAGTRRRGRELISSIAANALAAWIIYPAIQRKTGGG